MLYLWPLYLSLVAVLSSALTFPLSRSKRHPIQRRDSVGRFSSLHRPKVAAVVSDDNSLDLATVNDVIYMANISIGGHSRQVQLDTGSSDVWINQGNSPLTGITRTESTFNLTYGIGWAFGHIAYADMEFAGITVSRQAFLDVSQVDNPALTYGAVGIVGLGFTSLSNIDAFVNGTGSSDGRSLLYNLFEDNVSQPNYIAFAMQRSKEPGDEVEGSFSIGEVEPQYKAILDTAAITTWPAVAPKRWNVLLDSLLIGNKHIPLSTTVPNAPSNKAVILLDSGTSYTYAPKNIVDQIYGGIQGASFDSTVGLWIVPCETEIDLAFQIAGRIFPLHPLDIIPKNRNGKCTGTFVPGALAVGAGEFDWLVGDNFLRSVYSVYDFGDFDAQNKMGDPYVKLLTLVEPNQASSEFVGLRGGTAKTDITYNAADNGEAPPNTVSLNQDAVDTLIKLGTFFPVMLGIMALNALVILILVIGGIVYLCRRRKRRSGKKTSATARTPQGRLSPMPMSTRNSYVAGSSSPVAGEPHTYEPVSMAITEDTFVPPSPGFRQFDGKPGDRPKSIATSKLYQEIGSEDALFSPPTPGFAKSGRPNSVAIIPNSAPISSLPQDQPFTAPLIALQDTDDNASILSRPSLRVAADQVSVKSQHSPTRDTASIHSSRHSRIIELPAAGDASIPAETTLVEEESSPMKMHESRPKSILVNAAPLASQSDEVNPTPSTAFYSPGSQTNFTPTQSPNVTPIQSPQQPNNFTSGLGRPPVPPAFRPRSTLRPNPSTADRPMSVGVLPSQQFSHNGSPTTPRSGSSLRPMGHVQPGMRPMSAAFPPQFHPEEEEDITTFEPPQPSFRRMAPNGGSGSNYRPNSMA